MAIHGTDGWNTERLGCIQQHVADCYANTDALIAAFFENWRTVDF